MLQHTFLHAPGIGAGTEATLWRSGARTWEAYLDGHARGWYRGKRFASLARVVEDSRRSLRAGDIRFFAARLPGGEQWRLFDEFRDGAAYVDIETTGLSYDADVTVVSMFAGGRTQFFVRGRDLHRFPDAVARYPLVVTFNGAQFDLPILRANFRGFAPRGHIDLRFPLRRLGYTGGLKAIEQLAGLRRPESVFGLDGFDAVILWRRYERGDRGALDTLLEYGRCDVENLLPLARLVTRCMRRTLGLV